MSNFYHQWINHSKLFATGKNHQLAAAQGNAEAQLYLGNMYRQGKGVAQDYTEALKWLKLAAAQGDALAQYALGFMYDQGQGVAQDYARAHMWFNLSAASGYAEAVKARDLVAARMTPQKLARECQSSQFKHCE